MILTSEQALTSIAIQQLVNEWAHELDSNDGRAIARLLSANCTYVVGAADYAGREAAAKFYADRYARLIGEAGSTPTQRHAVSNLLCSFETPERATASFTIVYFASPEPAPVEGFSGPVAVADCRMAFVRVPNEGWLIDRFESTQSFRLAMT